MLACAAAGSASFTLVQWLSARTRQEVVHRRYASSLDLDVGTDLVDFVHEGRLLRVIAMARGV